MLACRRLPRVWSGPNFRTRRAAPPRAQRPDGTFAAFAATEMVATTTDRASDVSRDSIERDLRSRTLLSGLWRAQLTALGQDDDGEGLPSLDPLVQLVRMMRRAAPRSRRLAAEVLVELLEEPEARATARAYAGRLIRSMRARSALADLGLLPAHGLFAELRERLMARVLPSHRPPHDLCEILRVVFDPVDAVWLSTVDDGLLGRLLDALTPDDEVARRTLAHATLRAVDLVSHRIAAAGEDPVLLAFDPDALDHDSPFLAQAEHVLVLTTALRERLDRHTDTAATVDPLDVRHVEVMLAQCQEAIATLRKRAPRTGATIRMTYELERLDDLRQRLALLLGTVAEDADVASAARVRLFRTLVEAQAEAERIRPLLRRGSHLVASEIASRAGRTGEHYITRTPRAWAGMWLAAGGAGLIVACLACFKVFFGALHAPPLVEAALFSFNYAAGFALVGALGLTIATKQPAMTAAAIAGSIDPARPAETRRLVETVQSLVRSQLAAILGNCLVALPAALLLSLGFAWLTGHPVADVEKAHHLAHDIDPIASLALPHAALTGVWLSLSGIVAGYVASSVMARHIPSRIARSRALGRWLGKPRRLRLARAAESSAGTLAGSIVLGILLGSTGTLGQLLGLPLDIRHVSFASANLGLSLATLGPAGVDLGRCIAGLLGIGALNLLVSFSLSLGLALHARRRSLRDVPHLVLDLSKSFFVELPSWILPVGASARGADDSAHGDVPATP